MLATLTVDFADLRLSDDPWVPSVALSAKWTGAGQCDIRIHDSIIRNNIGGSWYTLPGISMHSDTQTDVQNSTIE